MNRLGASSPGLAGLPRSSTCELPGASRSTSAMARGGAPGVRPVQSLDSIAERSCSLAQLSGQERFGFCLLQVAGLHPPHTAPAANASRSESGKRSRAALLFLLRAFQRCLPLRIHFFEEFRIKLSAACFRFKELVPAGLRARITIGLEGPGTVGVPALPFAALCLQARTTAQIPDRRDFRRSSR